MRIRATVAAVSGALALSALAVPAAQADSSRTPDVSDVHAIAQATGKSAYAAAADGVPYDLDASFSNVKVNKGKNIVVGTTSVVKVPVTFTLTHAENVDIKADDFFAGVELYRGADFYGADFWYDSTDATCTASSATVASCTATVALDPAPGDDWGLINADAGTWKAAGFAVALNGEDPESPNLDNVGVAVTDSAATLKVQRLSKLTVNASPEPVKKGKTITVTGKLSRANWDTDKYAGYASQSVKLQFRKKGSSTYSTIKTIKTSSTGTLSTTVKASADGYYRYSFAGTSTTPAVNAAGDFIDVK
ncbi:hypothetical protein [Streptomyces sp. S.PB5]|uniref:hypothetical protein n=1 Tax=Streptomyces sp. S.PB5 TaxID=3020844 RepID=UPI0025AF2897|nr:hypothetical protein [Streptomyces sp. S.PB5]MDN3023377.1 hypothetical protein [Streptomyces sp. S.PB5]